MGKVSESERDGKAGSPCVFAAVSGFVNISIIKT